MKIKSIRAVELDQPKSEPKSKARRDPWSVDAEVANPMSKFPAYKRHRSLWQPKWKGVWVQAIAEDGTYGIGQTTFGRPVAAIIDDHFGPILEGESCFAIEKCWDMMFRMSKPYGSSGLASCAMSGVDLALWDLVGKLQDKPVYELMGGPVKDRIFCYATGNDTDWFTEIGFEAVKLACPYGPADGLKGLDENERIIAKTREQVGDDVEIMLDCYMAFDVEYTVRLANRLKPYKLKWMEEFLIPEDIDGHRAVREAVNWTSLASGEHLYSRYPYMRLVKDGSLDILQPDIMWVGGLSECIKIAHMAEGAGLQVMLHGGGNIPYGQHFTAATSNSPWAEYFVASPPGIPLGEAAPTGRAVPKDGWLVPNDTPGFGIEVIEESIRPFGY
ncbi:MAG TPA: L-rhamnonate dehydratase [Candidatus Latescibacteria bacterium]|nr:L-rhamnonate dehydratase [Gemmatimonadota bacterium]HCR19090.1 L-rhamnonate dehydratase [Candidatus Latescibacterota bacterium]|tara:strand:- start:97 stop:1257 length:1161 start_codon:yes stop_codon:yes gene_type:complete